ncbi:MAG: vanadium-dependent haloperoxidase [Variovorax sp.]
MNTVRAGSGAQRGLTLLLSVLMLVGSLPAAAADAVTQWSLLADSYGRGNANWRTLAIMNQAMHDAANAASPTFARWFSPAAGEPPANVASAQTAMAAAASRVLALLHPDHGAETQRALGLAIASESPGPARDAGVALGIEIGTAAVQRRASDGGDAIKTFAFGAGPGEWRGTPTRLGSSTTTAIRPFLFAARESVISPPPPALGSLQYIKEVEEARSIGAADSAIRTAEQTDAANFWASQSSQRGYVYLAIQLLDAHPRQGGLIEHARVMSQLTVALADSAILTWSNKERYARWRPVTAIRLGGFGVTADPNWLPVIETPPFPEYPSGHASDCFTGSAMLQAAFGPEVSSVTYVSQRDRAPESAEVIFGMGEHKQNVAVETPLARSFPSLAAAAEECSNSRIWAGAHYRSGDEESRRLAGVIAAGAAEAVPVLP